MYPSVLFLQELDITLNQDCLVLHHHLDLAYHIHYPTIHLPKVSVQMHYQ